MRNLTPMIILLMLAALTAPGTASAHRLGVYAYPDGDKLYAEGYYMDGRPCASCTIAIYNNATGIMITRGATDADGILSSPLPKASSIRVELTAPGGHRSEQIVALSAEGAVVQPQTSADNTRMIPTQKGDAGLDTATHACSCIEEKLASIQRELRHLRQASERPGITEILGGIGYIVGIMGIWAYMKGRREGN